MSFTSHTLFTTPPSSHFLPSLKTPPSLHFQNLHFKPQTPKFIFTFAPKPQTFAPKALNFENPIDPQPKNAFNIDQLLSIAEILCIVSSTVVVISYCTVLSTKRAVIGVLGSGKVLGWGVVALIGGVVVGGWIRRRQWELVSGGERESGNWVERVEKLEEEMRSFAAIVRVLSRQVEKLGIRFRVTRKSLKDPIDQTAALAQKNSEATRVLAMQEDLLEKELVEIQKVLLAMQEQQQKQLELILAIAKSGKLWESGPGSNQEQAQIKKSDSTESLKKLEIQETHSSGASVGNNYDRP